MSKNGRDRLAEALEALKTLQDAGPCYAIKGMKTLGETNSRMLLENGFLEEVEFPSGNKDVVPRSPLHMESVGELKTRPVPPCGGDTDSVLEEMGYRKEQIEDLKAKGIAKQA